MKKKLTIAAAMVLGMAVPAAAQLAPAGTEADHAALRQLKDDLTRAINAKDFETARTLVHKPMMATAVTQDSFTDFDGLVGFYRSLFTRDSLRMKEVTLSAEADELSQIYTGTFAVTRGSTSEHYVLADGRSFDLKGRWTATSIREADGKWKVLAIHTGTNFLDNPVLGAIEKALLWAGLGGGALGLVLGLILGRLWGRRRAAAPAA